MITVTDIKKTRKLEPVALSALQRHIVAIGTFSARYPGRGTSPAAAEEAAGASSR